MSIVDGGLERWIADGYETTDMMVKKKVFTNNSLASTMVFLPFVSWGHVTAL